MLDRQDHEEQVVDGPLTVAWSRYGQDVVVVALAGEMDASNVVAARDVIDEALTGADDEILVLDLSALEFIDSAGIALLIGLSAADREGHRLRIVPSEAPAVSRIMQLTGVEAMMQIAREHPARAA